MSKFKLVKTKIAGITTAISVSALSASQSMASVLPSDIDTQFGNTQADILTVGGLIIGLAVVALGIRWVKATFF